MGIVIPKAGAGRTVVCRARSGALRSRALHRQASRAAAPRVHTLVVSRTPAGRSPAAPMPFALPRHTPQAATGHTANGSVEMHQQRLSNHFGCKNRNGSHARDAARYYITTASWTEAGLDGKTIVCCGGGPTAFWSNPVSSCKRSAMRDSTVTSAAYGIHKHVRTYVHECMHACMHACIQYVHTYIGTCARMCVRSDIHMMIHTTR